MGSWDDDPWGRESGEDTVGHFDGRGHVRAAPPPQAYLLGEPKVVTTTDRVRGVALRLVGGLVVASGLIAGVLALIDVLR